MQLDEKNLPFHDALDHFVFLYFANAYQATFAYIKKMIVLKDFKLLNQWGTNPGPMEKLS